MTSVNTQEAGRAEAKQARNHTTEWPQEDRLRSDNHGARISRRRARAALAVLALTVGLTSVGPSSAVTRPTSFRDSFDTLGPLAGVKPSDPWEIKRGDWEVVDLADLGHPTRARRVLRQNSTAGTPKEPVVMVRNAAFRSFTVQVTAAMLDSTPASSVGIVFRSPILEDSTADPSNLYLFSAINTGIITGFPTGRAFALFKRVGEGYFMLDNKIAHTWADLTQPHDYKVVMEKGHIQAFVDGRLVIEHTDIPSGDQPTKADPFPGLPFHAGSVGLRTSAARAWFDDFVIVADDAYEGRANAVEAHASGPLPTDGRSGTEHTLTNELDSHGLNLLDTGFVYSDEDYDTAIVQPFQDGSLEFGASLRTHNEDDRAVSTARLLRFHGQVTGPTGNTTVEIDAAKIDTTVTASCDDTTSQVDLARTTITVTLGGPGAPETTIGPFPIASRYNPNTILYEQAGFVQIIAHRTRATTMPHRVETSALTIRFPQNEIDTPEINVAGNRILPRQDIARGPVIEVDIAQAVAGRYCSPMVEKDTD